MQATWFGHAQQRILLKQTKSPQSQSCRGAFFHVIRHCHPADNGAVLNIAQLIKVAMLSAVEAELGALYINLRKAVPMRLLLAEMGHTQPPTPTQSNNSMALGVVNSNIQPRRTKAMDVRFHWLRCREAQWQFRFFWRPSKTNVGEYCTKHYCAVHHI